MDPKRAAVINTLTELRCGLCLREGTDTVIRTVYALERMQAMLTHWHYAHSDTIVPALDQNCWRTGVVYPLDYAPARTIIGGQMAMQSRSLPAAMKALVDDVMPSTKPVVASSPPPVIAQVMVREVRGSTKRSKKRWQVYVVINNKTRHDTPLVDSLNTARVLRDAISAMLSKAIGDNNVTVLDYC